ncbi:MAG: LamG-like jellyroll fold domain-containing protein [Gammaproteobacteria bacterium]
MLGVAAERHQLLATLIEDHPGKVLQLAVPDDLRGGMPTEVQRVLEQRLELEGELEVLQVDYKDPSQSRSVYVLKTSFGERFSLHFAAHPPGHLSGARVRAHGLVLYGVQAKDAGETDGAMALEDGNTSLETLESGGSASTDRSATAAPSLPGTIGEQRTVVLLVNFEDHPTDKPWMPERARRLVFGKVSDFFKENSYRQTWLAGNVHGWYTLPIASMQCDQYSIAKEAKSAAAAAGIDLSGYKRFVYVFPKNSCTWSSLSTVGGSPSESWINNDFTWGRVARELGHGFGLFHSHGLDCTPATLGSKCRKLAAGDTLDVMGRRAAHLNAFQKERLGWLNFGAAPSINTIEANGTYDLEPIESGGIRSKALKVLKGMDPATGNRTWYYIEHRQAIGFDSWMLGDPDLSEENVLNGVVLHLGTEEVGGSSLLLDMTPDSVSTHGDLYDPALPVGQSYSDPETGLTITTAWANGSNAGVAVSFARPGCVRANPALSLSPSRNVRMTAGAPVTYNIGVTDNDPAACGAAQFDLSATVPKGWTATFADATLGLIPGASASTTLTVTSPPSASDRTYEIVVTAENSGSPASAASVAASYAVNAQLHQPSADGAATMQDKELPISVPAADADAERDRPSVKSVTQSADGQAAEVWKSMDPGGGGGIVDLLVHPSDPSIVWAVSDLSGIFKSTDGGVTWHDKASRIKRESMTYNGSNNGKHTLAMDPTNPNTLYYAFKPMLHKTRHVKEGLWRSRDGGDAWSHLGSATSALLDRASLIVDRSGTLFAAETNTSNLWVSKDQGDTFVRKTLPFIAPPVDQNLASKGWALRMVVSRGNRLYVANPVATTNSTRGLFYSDNEGSTWTAATGLAGKKIYAVDASPVDPKLILALAFVSGSPSVGEIYRSTDGSSFVKNPITVAIGHPSSGKETGGIAINGKGTAIAWGTGKVGDAMAISTDQGKTFARYSPGFSKGSYVYNAPQFGHATDIAASPVSDNWYTSNMLTVFRSADNGRNFTGVAKGIEIIVPSTIVVDISDPGRVHQATLDNGHIYTTNLGATWSTSETLFFADNVGMAQDPNNPNVFYKHLVYKPASGVLGLWKSTDRGVTWSFVSDTPGFRLPSIAPPHLSLLVDPTKSSRIYAGYCALGDAGLNPGLYVSNNSGASFSKVPGSPSRFCQIVQGKSGKLYGLTLSTTGDLYSFDPATGVSKKLRDNANGGLSGFAVHPTNENILFAAEGSFRHHVLGASGTVGRLLKSTDGGTTWQEIKDGAGKSYSPWQVYVDPARPTAMLMSTYSHFEASGLPSGVMRSLDGGATWQSFHHNLSHNNVRSFTYGGVPGRVYAATFNMGTHRLDSLYTATAPTDDTVPPTAPKGLTATVTSATRISLGWDPSTDNVGVKGYRVFRCTGAACVPTTMVAEVSGTTFADASLAPGTAYHYRVRAEDAAGNLSEPSATVSATTDDTLPPTAPKGLTATVTSATRISLGWDPSTDNVGVKGYRVLRCTGAACVPTTMVAEVSGTTFADASLAPGTTYGYRVRAEDAAGNLSEPSATVSATTPDPFDYSLSSGGSLTIVRGSSGSTTVTRARVAGTAEPVVLSISGLPSGATATLTNNACTPTCTSTLSVATTVSTPIGTYTLTLTGTPLSKTTSLTLNVQGGVTGGLASYWPYDEGAGTSAQDASKNGWTSTLVRGTAWTAGTRGRAVKFDGVDDQVHAGDIPASSAKTWVFWMKLTGDASRCQGLFDKYANANGREWRMYLLQGALRLQVGRGATGHEERVATGFKAVSNAWTHVAVVFDGATGGFQVYKDGAPVATSGKFSVGAIRDTTTPVYIGYRRLGGEHFSGNLDELRIYNRALSITEIQTLRADAGP